VDIISHALIGAAIGEVSATRSWRRVGWCALLAASADFPQALFLYPYVAYVHGRADFIPRLTDWDHFRSAHAVASAIWELPHSVFFLALVVVPLVLYTRLPRAAIAAYASHLFIDIFTHTGEWSVAPLWPLPWRVEGFCDPWRWTPAEWAASIGSCAALWLVVGWLAAHYGRRVPVALPPS